MIGVLGLNGAWTSTLPGDRIGETLSDVIACDGKLPVAETLAPRVQASVSLIDPKTLARDDTRSSLAAPNSRPLPGSSARDATARE
jgi:hypothetical protein